MTNTEKQYFTTEEMAADLIAVLEDFTGYYCDLHNETFNTDYYIISSYEAEKALAQYGTFSAIEEIRIYEAEYLGEFNTEIQAEKIANMLYYIKAEEFMLNEFEFYAVLEEAVEDLEKDYLDLWNAEATTEVNQYIIRKLLPFTAEGGAE